VAATFITLAEDERFADVVHTGIGHLRDLVTSRELLDLARLDLEGKTDAQAVIETYDQWTSTFFDVINRSTLGA